MSSLSAFFIRQRALAAEVCEVAATRGRARGGRFRSDKCRGNARGWPVRLKCLLYLPSLSGSVHWPPRSARSPRQGVEPEVDVSDLINVEATHEGGRFASNVFFICLLYPAACTGRRGLRGPRDKGSSQRWTFQI